MSAIRKTLFATVSLAAFFTVSPLTQAHPQHDALDHATTAPAPNAQLESESGTVRELVIDDRVANMSMRYLSLVRASGEASVLAGKALDALSDGDSATVTGRRNGNVLFVESAQAVKSTARRPTATRRVEGRLALAHADDFVTGKSQYLYEVHGAAGEVTALKIRGRPDALQPGMKVSAAGDRDAATNELDPSRIEILALPAESTTSTTSSTTTPTGMVAKATASHSVLVVAFKFSDTASDPLPVASVQNVMTGTTGSVAKFFAEASYGQHLLNVTVPSQWFRSATMATPTTCNYTALASAGDAAAVAAGYSPSSYEFRVYMFPRVAACGWSGLAYIGSPKQAWINGPSSVTTSVVGHEMGHNFGLLHAASVDCGARAIGGTCSVSEYGDPFNTMGNQRAAHFDATQKALLGWIPATSVKTHSTGSATYVLSPIENAGAAVYAVKIPASAKRTYWLEYRQPIGFDAFLSAYPNNGAQVRVASPFETLCGGCDGYSDDTQLLDLTTSTATFTDGTLPVGGSYTDPNYGFTINVISATPTALTVQVSGPGTTTLGPQPTTSAVASSRNPSTPGAAVTFTASVTGTSPTGTVSFTDNGVSVVGCSAVALAGTGNTRTAACTTAALTVASHAIVAKYNGDTANVASTSATLTEVVNSTTTTTTNTNVALASAGATATASSNLGGYEPSHAINGAVTGMRVSSDMWWNDANPGVYPDWLQVNFAGTRTISSVVVYSLQDNYSSGIAPTDTTKFTAYGLRDFTVQGWNGSAWVTLGTVTGNNLVKRTVNFTAFATARIRVNVTNAISGYSRVVEVQAWGH
jgi:hypothetical protein